MGYSLSWLAIKSKAPQAVLDELGFRRTGERQEIPEAALTAAEMPNGWFLIVSNEDEKVATDAVLERLTAGCEAVTCFVEEHVMCSSSTGWKDGRKCWSILHDAQKGRGHLEAEGQLPSSFNSIRDRLLSKQQEENARRAEIRRPLIARKVVSSSDMACDYIFNIPVEVACELTGYQHDRDIAGMTGELFEVLVSAALKQTVEKRSFWKRLFGA
jgi:hypothetical protein